MLVGCGQTGSSHPVERGLKWYHVSGGDPSHTHDLEIPLLRLWLTKTATDIHEDLTTTMF